MSVNKQESGYQRAPFTTQPLNGAVPKTTPLSAENWARGDLSKAFKTPPNIATPKLQMAEPRDAAAKLQQQAQAQEQTEKPQAAKADNLNQQTATSRDDLSAPQRAEKHEGAKSPATAAALKPAHTAIPPQFAPIMLAGALSAQHNTRAAQNTAPQDDYQDIFSIKSSNYGKRLSYARMEEEMNEGYGSHKKNQDEELLMAYAAEQQRQQFTRTMEYATALRTVDNTMREQETRLSLLHTEEQQLTTQLEIHEERIEELSEEIEVKEERVDDIETDLTDLDEQKENTKETEAALAEQEKLQEEIRKLPTIKMYKGDKGDYFQTNENGKEVTYLTTPDGEVKVVPEEDLMNDSCQMPLATYLKSNPDGSVTFQDENGKQLTQEKIDKLNRFMEKTGKTGAELGDMDKFKELKTKATEHSDTKVMESLNKAVASESRLAKSLDKIGVPRDQAHNLEQYLRDEKEQLKTLKKDLEKEEAAGQSTKKELDAKRAEIEQLQKEYDENKAFRKRLVNGEFENETKMLAAMPPKLEKNYEENKKQAALAHDTAKADTAKTAPAATTTPAPTAAADNTSRVNGSAAAAYDGAAKTGAISTEFKAAATTPATPTQSTTPAAPAANNDMPAIDDNMEFVAARATAKPQALGLN